jgi:anti-sigma-K factor RskA
MIVDHGFKHLVDAWDRKLAPLHQMVESVEPPADLWDRIRLAAGVGAARTPDAGEGSAPQSGAADSVAEAVSPAVGPASNEPIAGPESAAAPVVVPEPVADPPREDVAASSNIVPVPARKRGGLYNVVVTALAAVLAVVVALQAYRPELLPEGLRVKPTVRVVEVRAPAPPVPAQSVAVLQQGTTQPAFILTVHAATRQLTVRRLAAMPEPNKSYELWLMSDRLPQPRSLGVIEEGVFTARSVLQDYDSDVVSSATYAVTIEPKGGSPTGVATGPIVYAGKLVESVPVVASPAR